MKALPHATLLKLPAPVPPAASLDDLDVGETGDAHDAERAFNFDRHWAVLVARAPREPICSGWYYW